MAVLSNTSKARRIMGRMALALLVTGLLACATGPMVNPAPIAAASTPARTRAAILRGVLRSHWTVASEKPGEVIVRLNRTAWAITVAIDYGNQVTVRYVNSRGMDYDDSSGSPTIHRGYNKRVAHLMNVVAREVTRERIPSS